MSPTASKELVAGVGGAAEDMSEAGVTGRERDTFTVAGNAVDDEAESFVTAAPCDENALECV